MGARTREELTIQLLRRSIVLGFCLTIVLACSRVDDDQSRPDDTTLALSSLTDRDSLLSPEERAREPEFGGVITMLSRMDPQTLNNVIRTGGTSRRVCTFLFPRLVDVHHETLEVFPLTAAALPERSPDELVHRWRLRQGLKWHDFEESGAYVTSADVKASYDKIMDARVDAGEVRGYLADLESLRVIDELTFETVYTKTYFNSWYLFGYRFRIMPAHLIKEIDPADFNSDPIGRDPVGYGSFRFHHWETGQEILLERCDLNREVLPPEVRPWIDGLRWKIVADSAMEMRLFERGEIDIFNLNHDDLFLKARREGFQKVATIHNYSLPWYSYIGWNTRSVLFEDKRVRQAMTHLMRREQILETHLYGLATVISGPIYCGSSAYDDKITPLTFDVERARALLAEAGWSDTDGNGILDREMDGELMEFRFELLIKSQPWPYASALFRALTEDLKKVGIVLVLRPLEWKTRLARIKDRKFDAFSLAKTGDLVYEDFYGMWHSSQIEGGGSNRVGYSNPSVDRILEQVRNSFDDNERELLLKEFHAILHEDLPMTPLYSLTVNAAINRCWRNVRIYPKGIHFYEWWLPVEKRSPSDTIPPPK